MNYNKLLFPKKEETKIKLLTVRDSATVAQFEHYIVSNSCLFSLDEEQVCGCPPDSCADEDPESKKNKPPE